MSRSHEAPTLVLDDPELGQPDPTRHETPPAAEDTELRRPELPADLKIRLGKIAIADEDGAIPEGPTKAEVRWRPPSPYYVLPYIRRVIQGHHQEKRAGNEIIPKAADAVGARALGYNHGIHGHTVDSTVATIQSIEAQLYGNQYRAPKQLPYAVARDHTKAIRTGNGTNQLRRPIARIWQAMGRIRSPEQQMSDHQKLSLREVGKLYNLDLYMADADASDSDGRLGDALRSGKPAAVRHELKVLSDEGVISEHSPLHARWSEAMDPENVKAFKQYLIESSDKDIHGYTPEAAVLYIAAAGIMGDMRPRAVADYLGVTFEEWHEQCTGFLVEDNNPIETNNHHKVPKEVVDQICLLMKLDTRVVDYVEVNGKKQPVTALDALIKVGAARPMTGPSRSKDPESPLSKSPMERVEDEKTVKARLELEEKDHNEAHIRALSMQYGANLEVINRKLASLDPEDEEDEKAYKALTERKAKLIARLKSLGIPVPVEQDTVDAKS